MICEYEEITAILKGFFEDEIKVDRWIETPNPMLGGISPQHMILLGRGQRLKNIILDRLKDRNGIN